MGLFHLAVYSCCGLGSFGDGGMISRLRDKGVCMYRRE